MKLKTKNKLISSLVQLECNVRKIRYHGHDPYDVLNFSRLDKYNSKYLNMALTQAFVYSPINFRNLIGIRRGLNPKGVGLFVKAYCTLEKLKIYPEGFCLRISEILANWLIKNKSKFSGNFSWGYNFPWQSSQRKLESGIPTIVNSSFIGDSFLELYSLTSKKKYLEVAESICEFILEDLQISKFDEGICFSYTPLDKHIVHNANVLGASLLDKVSKLNNSEKYARYSNKAFNYTISQQKSNGMWPYSLDRITGTERNQIDWHQGFILDSLCEYLTNNPNSPEHYFSSMINGSEFYANKQFTKQGVSKWRWPKVWPVDIHNQAQGIITFANLSSFDGNFLLISEKIATWTIVNFKKDNGFFEYQKWSFLSNKTIYMRWSQAWMLLALSKLAYEKEVRNKNE